DEGSFTTIVTLAEDAPGTASATASNTVTVTEGDVLVPASQQPIVSTLEGVAYSGAVATFTNTGYPGNPADDFSATILWGDGTSSTGFVSGGAGADLTVSGTHFYADEGVYSTTVTIQDDAPGGATGTAVGTATV